MMDFTFSSTETRHTGGYGSSDSVSEPAVPDRRVELLLAMRRHLQIVHHIPGRLRLRATAGLLDLARAWRGERIGLDEAVGVIDGIRSARVNAVAATAVIEYDPRCVPQEAWHLLLHGDDHEALQILQRHVPGLGRHLESIPGHASKEED